MIFPVAEKQIFEVLKEMDLRLQRLETLVLMCESPKSHKWRQRHLKAIQYAQRISGSKKISAEAKADLERITKYMKPQKIYDGPQSIIKLRF